MYRKTMINEDTLWLTDEQLWQNHPASYDIITGYGTEEEVMKDERNIIKKT